MGPTILLVLTGALMLYVFWVVMRFMVLFLGSIIVVFNIMNLILGKTNDPLNIKNKTGMMLNSKGKVNYQSVRK
ncbi:hypothetical protein HGB24_02065 [Candidatus Saccharibacteria bacterium]|nr:hypothetical protein [Candidatus Saccharibacteria bacterium]